MFKIRETPREKRLNAQRVIFSREYVIDLNPGRAALAAGLATEVENADHVGKNALQHPRVKPLVQYLQQNRAQRLDIKADRVVEELARLAFSNMLDFMKPDKDGHMQMDFSELTRDQAAAIAQISEDTTGGSGDGERKLIVRTTLKLADKLKALDLLCKHLGLYQAEKVDLNINVSIAENVRAARRRLEIVKKPIECLPAKRTA